LSDIAHVYAIDLPGFGESPSFTSETASIGDYAKSVFKFMDDVGVKKAVVGGCSMGGYILFEMWRQDPARIGGLIFMNTRCEVDSQEGEVFI
jgi:pimeloyl-ACP methyl ester carboxylesterase